MRDNIGIKTTKLIYPQIYAYITPNLPENDGWIKIGFTERKDVHVRILEQTKTAAINLDYELLWSAPAKFSQATTIDDWFKDKELHSYLRKFKNVKQRHNTEWFYYNGTPEKARLDFDDFLKHNRNQIKEELSYKLREEQQQAINQTIDYANDNPEGEFLWNAKPRFGKTLTTYDFARKLNANKVLIVTNRPSIANSWFDDFEKFIAWQTDYAFVSTSDSLKNRPALTRKEYIDQIPNGKKNLIAFISLQDLKGSLYFGGSFDKLDWVKEIEWDLLVIDEAHEGVDTHKTDVAFDLIKRKFTLHLSGTPFKALADGKFRKDEIYNWTYSDEQAAKAQWNNSDEQNPYEKLPKLNLFSYQMSQMITDEVNKGANIDGDNIEYTFDLNEFFITNDSGRFVHEADVKKWIDTLTRNQKYPFSSKEFRDELKHTFWLLNRVSSARALQKLLKNHPVFESYEIILAAGDGRVEDDELVISQKALDKVRQAIKNHDKTITLSVGQLTTGITIPEWTAVLMLSNLKSPSLYMQAAFRAQNPWEYQINGEVYQKQNAYVFDFAPERTLTIYEEFANNLSRNTSGGSGTSEERKENIKQLLNFFPVIAEDNEGKMVELNVNQVLTLPKVFKAQEVVRRGFMSNFLFQNVSGIFASEKARGILEQLNPVDAGTTFQPRKTEARIDTQSVHVDKDGNVAVDNDLVVAKTEANFGEKVYGNIQTVIEKATKNIDRDTLLTTSGSLSQVVGKFFEQSVKEGAKGLAKDIGLANKIAEQALKQSTDVIVREVEILQKHTEIKQKEAEVEFKKVLEEAKTAQDQFAESKIEEAKKAYECKQNQIVEEFEQQVKETVTTKSKELIKQTTKTILEKAEDKKKNSVEDEIRSRLRGFARTIPSFLMAYGSIDTTLSSFDKNIKDTVFIEVTGITLEQFRILRDEFKFFDETVFNQSVQEFIDKRRKLANYFDNDLEENIFDYIPPQKTNQMFTPRWVVKMMIDKMEIENPEIFKQADKTFADLYIKSGLYLTEIIKRLYVGLEEEIPDANTRIKHILENQIYGFAPSEIILNIVRNFIFGFDEKLKNIDQSHIVLLDTIPYGKGETDISFEMKCDQIFGSKHL